MDSLLYLLRNANDIESIDLQGCERFDYNDLIVAIGPLSGRPSLKRLDLSGIDARSGFQDFFRTDGLKINLERLTVSTNKTKAWFNES